MQQATPTITNESLLLIEEHIRQLLAIMGFNQVRVRCEYKSDAAIPEHQQLRIAIMAGDEGRLLIGVHGSHLSALQHVIRSMVRKQLPNRMYIMVDVNDYTAARKKVLENIAEAAAQKATKTGRVVVLSPMNAAERHTVHTALSSRNDLKTESVGEDPNRRIIIRPVFI